MLTHSQQSLAGFKLWQKLENNVLFNEVQTKLTELDTVILDDVAFYMLGMI